MTSERTPNSQSDSARLRQWLRVGLGRAITITVITGLCVRVSIRDSVPYLSTIYYATPLPLLVAGCVVASFLLKGRSSRTTRLMLPAVGFLCAGAFCFYHYETPVSSEVQEYDQAQLSGSLKVAFWNVARGLRGWDSVVDTMQSIDADVMGIVECNMPDEEVINRLHRAFPDCEIAHFHHNMVLLSRYPILSIENRYVDNVASFGLARIQIAGEDVQFVVADITSRPLQFRKRPMDSIERIATEFLELPTVIMGDFNTPIESVFLNTLRNDYVNTFEEGGSGFDSTWPVPCPVMAIDQMWVNRKWNILTAELGWTWVSDHRPIVTELSLNF